MRRMKNQVMANQLLRGYITLATLALLLMWQTARAQETISLYTYYDYPPFQTANGQGLLYGLAEYLSRKSNGKYAFSAYVLPRKRLDYIISPNQPDNWVVAFAVPKFFADEDQSKFSWSGTLMRDLDFLISRREAPIVYTGPESLYGKRFGGTLGHRYAFFEDAIADGKIVRDDCLNMECNVRRLILGRIDATILSNGAIAHYRTTIPEFSEQVFLPPQPIATFDRRLMCSKQRPELQQFLDNVIYQLPHDPAWAKMLKGYQ